MNKVQMQCFESKKMVFHYEQNTKWQKCILLMYIDQIPEYMTAYQTQKHIQKPLR